MTDPEILQLIVSGDRQAMKDFYDKFKAKVYNTSLSYLQNPEEAEEITQDVFLEVFDSIGKFKAESSISTWIYRITVNKSLDQIRFRKRKKRMGFLLSLFNKDSGKLQIDLPHFEHPGVAIENKESAGILFTAIGSLPEQQKTAFILSQIEELPQKEIADVMKLSQKAVESLIQRAKANLRKELENFYPERRKIK